MEEKDVIIVDVDRRLADRVEETFAEDLQGGRKHTIRINRALKVYLDHPELWENRDSSPPPEPVPAAIADQAAPPAEAPVGPGGS